MTPIGTLNQIIANIPVIAEDCKYWVIRTERGRYYQEYSIGGYVAINYDQINYKDLLGANNRFDFDSIDALIVKFYPNKKRVGLIRNQLLDFCFELKKGDIVIIPNEGSTIINIGVVSDNIVYTKDMLGANDDCPYHKRRKINWTKEVNRLRNYKISASHLAIYNVTGESVFINRLLYDWYRVGDNYHFLVSVKSDNPIFYKELTDFSHSLINLVEDFAPEIEVDESVDTIQSKIELASPGYILLIGAGLIGLLFVVVINSFVKSKTKVSFKFGSVEFTKESETEGLLNAVSKFISERKKEKSQSLYLDAVEKFINKHDVQEPKDLENLLESLEGHKKLIDTTIEDAEVIEDKSKANDIKDINKNTEE